MDKKKRPAKLGNPQKFHKYSNSKPNQRARILKAFKEKPHLSTFTLRKMGIVSPAPRIGELRDNHEIVTEWTDEADENGVMHHIALYVYYGKKCDQGGN